MAAPNKGYYKYDTDMILRFLYIRDHDTFVSIWHHPAYDVYWNIKDIINKPFSVVMYLLPLIFNFGVYIYAFICICIYKYITTTEYSIQQPINSNYLYPETDLELSINDTQTYLQKYFPGSRMDPCANICWAGSFYECNNTMSENNQYMYLNTTDPVVYKQLCHLLIVTNYNILQNSIVCLFIFYIFNILITNDTIVNVIYSNMSAVQVRKYKKLDSFKNMLLTCFFIEIVRFTVNFILLLCVSNHINKILYILICAMIIFHIIFILLRILGFTFIESLNYETLSTVIDIDFIIRYLRNDMFYSKQRYKKMSKCMVCYEKTINYAKFNKCKHGVCMNCINTLIPNNINCCPYCQTPFYTVREDIIDTLKCMAVKFITTGSI